MNVLKLEGTHSDNENKVRIAEEKKT